MCVVKRELLWKLEMKEASKRQSPASGGKMSFQKKNLIYIYMYSLIFYMYTVQK